MEYCISFSKKWGLSKGLKAQPFILKGLSKMHQSLF
jgi:hypothetical protein